MEILILLVKFILYMIIGMLTVYFISDPESDRAYSNPFQGLMAIFFWPLLLIYKIYTKFKQLFITLTNLKNKTR